MRPISWSTERRKRATVQNPLSFALNLLKNGVQNSKTDFLSIVHERETSVTLLTFDVT
jgi:hypothetical protein